MINYDVFEKIAKQFGTPTYVYNERKILSQIRSLMTNIAYEPKTILYAMKANDNPRILEIFEKKFIGIDAVSTGEIALALGVGFLPKNIVFTGNNMTDEEMDFAVKRGVFMNIDSLSRLEKFGKKYPGRNVSVRINPDVGDGHHDHCITGGPDSKFGIWHSEASGARKIAKKYKLKIIGIHEHIGSGILDAEKFMTAMEVLLKVALGFPDLNFIDFGGGLGVPYEPEEKELDMEALGRKMTNRFISFCDEYGKRLNLAIEPGRYLVAESGFLLTTVNTIKKYPGGKVFVGVNSGFNHLIRPAMYKSYHPVINISNPGGKGEKVDVVGNICESGDKFAVDRIVSKAREGDLIAIGCAGAYGYTMASNYNKRPKPAEVLVESNGVIKLIRERETVDSLVSTALVC